MSEDFFFGLDFIDIVYDNVHPPDPLKFAQELLDHNIECFTSRGLLISTDMPLIEEASVKQGPLRHVNLMVSIRADVGPLFHWNEMENSIRKSVEEIRGLQGLVKSEAW
jgi:hypothetical protein